MESLKYILISSTFLLTTLILHAQPQETCHIKIDDCPEIFNGQTIIVPSNAVAISPELTYCAPSIESQDSSKATPSIVFIIDNTGSNAVYDPAGERYEVTLDILQEISINNPKTRAGIVVFTTRLSWDHRDNPDRFERINNQLFNDSGWNDSYFPIVPLDTIMPDGKTGLETIQELLVHEYSGKGGITTFTQRTNERLLSCYGISCNAPEQQSCTDRRDGTDITLAFMGAKSAFANDSLRYPNNYSCKNQYIILITDGNASNVNVSMCSYQMDFVQGKNVPTTFTIYLGNIVPQELKDMILNIRNNNYCPDNNPNQNSNLWSMNGASRDNLLRIMREEILSQMSQSSISPHSAHIGSMSTQSFSNGAAIFNQPIPLDEDTSDVLLSFRYLIGDSATGQSDTTVSSTLKVIRNPQITTWDLPSGIVRSCYQRDLILYSQGVEVTSEMTAENETLTVELSLDGTYLNNPSITASNSDMSDSVRILLTSQDDLWVGNVIREQSDTVISGDNILQHKRSDRITFTWNNPENPLDFVQKSYVFWDGKSSAKNIYNYRIDNKKAVTIIRKNAGLNILLSAKNPGNIELIDSKGKIILSKKLNFNEQKGITVSRLPNGIFFIKIGENNKRIVHKVSHICN